MQCDVGNYQARYCLVSNMKLLDLYELHAAYDFSVKRREIFSQNLMIREVTKDENCHSHICPVRCRRRPCLRFSRASNTQVRRHPQFSELQVTPARSIGLPAPLPCQSVDKCLCPASPSAKFATALGEDTPKSTA